MSIISKVSLSTSCYISFRANAIKEQTTVEIKSVSGSDLEAGVGVGPRLSVNVEQTPDVGQERAGFLCEVAFLKKGKVVKERNKSAKHL